MHFDWRSFFEHRQINFVTRGPNTKRGNISIQCPFCGDDDRSQHMGIDLSSGVWGCLRNAAHRGKSPVRLLRKLLRCSEDDARRILGLREVVAPTMDSLVQSFRSLSKEEVHNDRPRTLSFPKEFRPLLNGSVFAEPFIEYFLSRGFRTLQIQWLAKNYDIQYATQGLYAYRVILPVYDRYDELLSWTARSIRPDGMPRYRTLQASGKGADVFAKIAINGTILGLPLLWRVSNTRALVIVEGPFDALKVTAFGASLGVYATALFGLNVYPSQVDELEALAARFDRVYLLLDNDAVFQRLRLAEALSSLGVKVLQVPFGRKDPGELSGGEVVSFCQQLISG